MRWCQARARRKSTGGARNAQSHASARARRLFGDRRPAAAEAARRRADRVLDHRQSGSVGHRQADGAPGAARADRRSRCCPTCRTGAGTNTACASACGASSTCSRGSNIRPTLSINARVCEDYARVAAAGEGRRLGVHGPFLRAGPDPQGAGPGRDDRALDGHSGKIHRQAPGRLARARPHADLRDAGAARRRGRANTSATGSTTTSRR